MNGDEPAMTHEPMLEGVLGSTVFKNLSDCVAVGRAIEPNMFAYEGLRNLLEALVTRRPDPEADSVIAGLREVLEQMGALLSVPGFNRVKDAIEFLERLNPSPALVSENRG